MNKLIAESAEQLRVAVVLAADDSIELEWGGVLDCGALGPSREEPILFYRDVSDWDVD